MAKKRYKRGTDFILSKRLMQAAAILFLLYFVVIPNLKLILAIAFYGSILYFGFRSFKQETKRKMVLGKDIKEVDAMNGVEFEQYLGVLFENMGYKVKFTPGSGDYGADLLLTKGNKVIAVQAKRYSNTVGIKAIQEVNGAKGFYRTNEAWVVTNNTFTKNACTFAERIGIRLIDRDRLIELIAKNYKENLAVKIVIPEAISDKDKV